MQLTVATYNVHHCEGTNGRVDVERVARIISDIQPDLIALQELDDGWERTGGRDQPAELARLTDLHISFFPTILEGNKRYGFALGARSEFQARYTPLPTPKGEEPRGVAVAEFDALRLVVTHLSTHWRTRRSQKDALAKIVGDLVSERPGHPVLVAGDLNHRPLSWGRLCRAGLEGGHPTPTFSSERPRRHIDHVLVGPGAQVRAQSAPRTTASDHLPLVAEVVLGP
jgi:endonuclease/exonuclease/phosphatase family metal-dependent hydrolase